jgi:MFS family permease
MFAHHNQHPFQYIAIVSVVFGIVGSRWIERYGRTTSMQRWRTIAMAMLLTIFISSPFGGLLWQIHDIQHGSMPEHYLGKIFQGISWGLEYGWLIALLSIPMNLIGFTVGYILLPLLAKSSMTRN